jgi:ubiquinone/menaquinone biosynthesis C-methylase UbiE
MEPTDPAKIKAQKTYDAAADLFDARPLGFWARYGERTVARLQLEPGATVLDVACGTGASALPAAGAVGPTGRVIGVDLAENLLTLAREKARRRGLGNVEFRQGDMTALGYPNGTFDAVICVFGIFFVKDMESLTAELWRTVKPGGRLAITTWGPRLFAPMYERWNEMVRGLRSDLATDFNPWDRITTPDAVRRLFADAGIPNAEVTPEAGSQPLDGPDDVWTVAAGSGLRWVIEQLGPDAERLRQEMLAWAQETRLAAIETNVIYGVATSR